MTPDLVDGTCPHCGGRTRTCPRCLGCGQIANTPNGEPWSAWAGLPLVSPAAVLVGLVKPIPCPLCQGRTVVPR